jgi:hypothetical protein
MPMLPMAATAGFVLPHAPPETVLPSVSAGPAHIGVMPEIVPAYGKGFTDTMVYVIAVPQLLVTV